MAGRSDRLKGQVTVFLQAASCGASGQVVGIDCVELSPAVSRWQRCWRPQPGSRGKGLVNCAGVRAQRCPVGPVLLRLLVVLVLLSLVLVLVLVLVPNLES